MRPRLDVPSAFPEALETLRHARLGAKAVECWAQLRARRHRDEPACQAGGRPVLSTRATSLTWTRNGGMGKPPQNQREGHGVEWLAAVGRWFKDAIEEYFMCKT